MTGHPPVSKTLRPARRSWRPKRGFPAPDMGSELYTNGYLSHTQGVHVRYMYVAG